MRRGTLETLPLETAAAVSGQCLRLATVLRTYYCSALIVRGALQAGHEDTFFCIFLIGSFAMKDMQMTLS